MLELGARTLERAANEVFTARQGWKINVARLEAGTVAAVDPDIAALF